MLRAGPGVFYDSVPVHLPFSVSRNTGFFRPPLELIKDEQVHGQLGGGGFRYDEDRVFTGWYLEPEAAQLTPNSNIRL